MPITTDQITIESFLDLFKRIVAQKQAAGIAALQVNPDDLLERARGYGTRFANGSWGWSSNIWSRSAKQTSVVDSDDELTPEHRILMRNVLERILCTPMIQADATLGTPGERAEMRCRLFCDPQFPDLAYRWQQLNFPGDPSSEPDAILFCIPHYLNNPNLPGTGIQSAEAGLAADDQRLATVAPPVAHTSMKRRKAGRRRTPKLLSL